jgi:hypothetical protein
LYNLQDNYRSSVDEPREFRICGVVLGTRPFELVVSSFSPAREVTSKWEALGNVEVAMQSPTSNPINLLNSVTAAMFDGSKPENCGSGLHASAKIQRFDHF